MVYHNFSEQDFTYPDYAPSYALAQPDGEILKFGYHLGGYFHKEDGWENGISGDPPPIPAHQSSFVWTWYGFTEGPGTFCKYFYVRWQGKNLAAEFDPKGKLINPNVNIPNAP